MRLTGWSRWAGLLAAVSACLFLLNVYVGMSGWSGREGGGGGWEQGDKIRAARTWNEDYSVDVAGEGGVVEQKKKGMEQEETRKEHVEQEANGEKEEEERRGRGECSLSPCRLDGRKMECVRRGKETFFPFQPLAKTLKVSGKEGKDGAFEWWTSYAKVKTPDFSSYQPLGVFGHFAGYSVETRERVRCISAETGVPMSTQWQPSPYYYPIQIAQYGLQHWSRMVAGSVNSTPVVLGLDSKEWHGSDGTIRVFHREGAVEGAEGGGEMVVNVTAGDQLSNAGAYVYLKGNPQLHVVSFDWQPYTHNSSFTLLVKVNNNNTLVLLNYVFGEDSRCVWNDSTVISSDQEQISFSYTLGSFDRGKNGSWRGVTRDALVDAARAMASERGKNVILHPGDVTLISLGFRGECAVRQSVRQKGADSEGMWRHAADWMVDGQDEEGGWAVPVERAIADRKLVLPAGWHSAMAQGHALSLLTRAYSHSKEDKYLKAATKALGLFEKPAASGGVRNELMGHAWYEEYPTTPGTYVLNGFLYSLIGLWDMSQLDGATEADRAKSLFHDGLASLRALLPLYDTGSGSIYDLRHVGLKTPPNLARWDYHAVHVYLLKWMVLITGDAQLDETADRWIGYAMGKRAKSN